MLVRQKGRRFAIRNFKQRKNFAKFSKIFSCCSQYITTVRYKAVHKTSKIKYKCEKSENNKVTMFWRDVKVGFFDIIFLKGCILVGKWM